MQKIHEVQQAPRSLLPGALSSSQGIGVYSPGLKKHRNIEEFLTTNEPSVRAHQGAEGKNKALFHASFVRLIRLSG
jgi:hypothetical protein